MLTKAMLFIGSVLNLLLTILYKIFRSLLYAFLVTMALAITFALILTGLLR